MTEFGFLLSLLLSMAQSLEELEPVFRSVGGELEMGYCFAVDYIAVFKLTEGGRQILHNSSGTTLPGESYRDRLNATNHLSGLLGMRVGNLKLSDTGVYMRECWRDNTVVNYHKHYLYVCDKEVGSQEIALLPDGSADLVCNMSYSGHSSRSIKWFREVYPGHKTSLFVDTKRSQEPIEEDLKGHLQVRDKGYSLHISEVGLKEDRNFYCLLMEGEQCMGFQNLHLPDSHEPEVRTVFYGVGEKVVLSCSFDANHLTERQKYWKTPFGQVDSTTVKKNGPASSEMYVLKSEERDYSLVIPFITPNHSGEYECFSPLLLAEYFITVCPKLVTNEIILHPGSNITLSCSSTSDTSIQWYRHRNFENEELIFDTGDPSVAEPTDMGSRMHILEAGTSLMITELTEDDSGTYWCVVLLDDMYYDDDFTDEDVEETEPDDEWVKAEETTEEQCSFKQVTRLMIQSTISRDYELESASLRYAVIGGVASIVVLVLIAVVVAVKMRVKRKAPNSSRTEPHTQGKESLLYLRHSYLEKSCPEI